MTLSEFKAWFEGFTENLDGPPNKKQWERIQKRVKQIRSDPSPVVVEKWLRPYYDRVWCSTGTGDVSPKFPSTCTYNALGKADALQISTSVSPTNG
jgi:hypothetical protein